LNTKKLRIKPLFKKNFYEDAAWQNNRTVCGIDEVGRGCLAGPLVTAAVILPPFKKHRLLLDSKILTVKEREQACRWIIKHCSYGIGIVSPQIIDIHNIWQATLLAMKKAVIHAIVRADDIPSALLVDAMPLSVHDTGYASIPVYHFIKGESKSSSIAAASIIAKVTRDRLMSDFESLFPGYGFSEHKGYATQKHKKAVVALGNTIIHRVSFLGNTKTSVMELERLEQKHYEQQSLC